MSKAAVIKTAKRMKVPRSMQFQAEFLDDESDEILVEKSRQIGYSEYTALKFVRYSIKEGAKYDTYILSCDEDNAKQTLADCKKWADIYAIGAYELGKEIIEDDTIFQIRFATGRTIHVLSSNPNRLAGKRGNVVLDEFALHKDQQKLLKVSSACTQWGGQRVIISTHRGKKTIFYSLCQGAVNGNPMGWSHYKITLEDAIDQGLLERINAKTGRNWTRESFIASKRKKCFCEADYLEEYMCIAQDQAGQLISWETVNNSVSKLASADARLEDIDGTVGLGVDVARKTDKHCYIGMQQVQDRYVCRLVYYHNDHSWVSRDRQLDRYTACDCVRLAKLDQTGIGDKYVEDAKLRRNGHKIRGVVFTPAVKEALATNVARLMESGKLLIPDHDLLKEHICAIERGYTDTGKLSYGADRTDSGHADLFWALALALDALTAKAAEGTWTREALDGVSMGGGRGKYRHQRRTYTPTRR
ncbi:terminase family protein [uncultured Akkermansia sp.]|uniref:phage terminase large subunit family protein n=1 Tax=uncultured Akkermansia sp. TaxID=512294 RepID=UPI0028059C84|nr:terminase family protein [uncultured Akkermansia sp.]